MKQAVCLALGADVKTELDRLAQQQDRSRSWLANYAIRQFLERNRASEPLIPGGTTNDASPRATHQLNAPHRAA
jgi:predicted transcriptional regulator